MSSEQLFPAFLSGCFIFVYFLFLTHGISCIKQMLGETNSVYNSPNRPHVLVNISQMYVCM